MRVLLLEVRDKATFMPVMAVGLHAMNPKQHWLLRRAGYSRKACEDLFLEVIVTTIDGGSGTSTCDPYDWPSRTMQNAHQYIITNFHCLRDGDVIDVEFILGESKVKKKSEQATEQ